MELNAAMRRRGMVRTFSDQQLASEELTDLLDVARRGPSAGNTQATSFLVLDTPEAVRAYWDVTLPPERRAGFRWQSLLSAPALVVVATDPSAYVSRYAETDKNHPRLGRSVAEWDVPYWWVDAGAVAQNILLQCTDRELGACLFGLFQHEPAVKTRFAVPDHIRLVATIAIGHPAPDEPGRSAARNRPPLSTVLHHNRWAPVGETAAGEPHS